MNKLLFFLSFFGCKIVESRDDATTNLNLWKEYNCYEVVSR